jgi:hypothetical protein
MTIPISMVRCAGTPRQCGQAHGEALRELIQAMLGRWRAALVRPGRPDPQAYLRNFLSQTSYLEAMERHTPELAEELRGIAAGAAVPFDDLLAFNLLDEEWWFSQSPAAQPPGCTVVGVMPPGGAPLLAQTMDIDTLYDGAQAVLRLAVAGRPEALVFTFAGMIGLNGCNADGVGVVVNNLSMLPHAPRGLPVAAVMRGALARRTLADAARFVAEAPHASGQHYAIGGPDGLLSLECSAAGAVPGTTPGGRLLHTNHPLAAAEQAPGWSPAATPNSCARYDYIAAHAGAAAAQADVEAILSDRSVPVSMAAAPGRTFTFGATSLALARPPRMRVTTGPPHEAPFVELSFGA